MFHPPWRLIKNCGTDPRKTATEDVVQRRFEPVYKFSENPAGIMNGSFRVKISIQQKTQPKLYKSEKEEAMTNIPNAWTYLCSDTVFTLRKIRHSGSQYSPKITEMRKCSRLAGNHSMADRHHTSKLVWTKSVYHVSLYMWNEKGKSPSQMPLRTLLNRKDRRHHPPTSRANFSRCCITTQSQLQAGHVPSAVTMISNGSPGFSVQRVGSSHLVPPSTSSSGAGSVESDEHSGSWYAPISGVRSHTTATTGMEDTPPEYQAPEFILAARRIMIRENSRRGAGLPSYSSVFGVSPSLTALLWLHIRDGLPPETCPKHLLWALLIVNVFANEAVNEAIVGDCRKPFRKWAWKLIKALANIDVVSTTGKKENKNGKMKKNQPTTRNRTTD